MAEGRTWRILNREARLAAESERSWNGGRATRLQRRHPPVPATSPSKALTSPPEGEFLFDGFRQFWWPQQEVTPLAFGVLGVSPASRCPAPPVAPTSPDHAALTTDQPGGHRDRPNPLALREWDRPVPCPAEGGMSPGLLSAVVSTEFQVERELSDTLVRDVKTVAVVAGKPGYPPDEVVGQVVEVADDLQLGGHAGSGERGAGRGVRLSPTRPARPALLFGRRPGADDAGAGSGPPAPRSPPP